MKLKFFVVIIAFLKWMNFNPILEQNSNPKVNEIVLEGAILIHKFLEPIFIITHERDMDSIFYGDSKAFLITMVDFSPMKLCEHGEKVLGENSYDCIVSLRLKIDKERLDYIFDCPHQSYVFDFSKREGNGSKIKYYPRFGWVKWEDLMFID